MPPTSIIIFIIASFALCIFYALVIAPRMAKKYKAEAEGLQQNFAESIRGREDETRREYLKNDTLMQPFTEQLQDANILGMISCMEKRSTKDFIRQQAIGAAGKVLGKVTGVRVKEVDNQDNYWLAITKENLHYLHYDDDGGCIEHLCWDLPQLNQIETGKPSTEEMFTGKAEPGTTRISFSSKDIKYKFFFFDNLWGHPLGKVRKDDKAQAAELNYLFAEPFKKLVARFEQT